MILLRYIMILLYRKGATDHPSYGDTAAANPVYITGYMRVRRGNTVNVYTCVLPSYNDCMHSTRKDIVNNVLYYVVYTFPVSPYFVRL